MQTPLRDFLTGTGRPAGTPVHQLPVDADQIDVEQMRVLADHLDRMHHGLIEAWGELAQLMRTPTPVWSRPSDRCHFGTEHVRTTSPQSIYGGLDKARISIVNVSESPDDGTTPAAGLHLSERAQFQPFGTSSMYLPAGATFTIDTRCALFVVADGEAAQLSWCIEEWDL